jgi:nitroreductase
MPAPDLEIVERVIRSRRTRKAFSGAPVDRAAVERLLDGARWAPNHRLTEPWRFYALDQAATARLIAFLRASPAITSVPDAAKAEAKLAKLIGRLPKAGALILVTWVRAADAAIDLEDHAAAAAAVQNLLLAATAMGLASFWSTSAALVHPLTLRWCGADPAREGVVGCVWLGHPVDDPTPPPRTPLDERLRWVVGS